MSIFGGSERFPTEAARSPGPIYTKPDLRANAQVVMKADYRPVDENLRWGKRESWIAGCASPQMPIVSKDSGRAPGHYNDNYKLVKTRAPKMSFPKSDRFLSQKVSMSGSNHQRELMAAESPGPKYNVNNLAANGGKAAPPRYSFAAPPSPKSTSRAEAHKTRLPDVGTSRRGHRDSWLSIINRNGVLVMPASPARPHKAAPTPEQATPEETHPPNNNASGKNGGNAFGHEHRFGKRQIESSKPRTPGRTPAANTRVQFVSSTHTRENMGEFSPGPIYAPYNPECPGGRLAPSPKSGRRPHPPGSPADPKDPHANLSSRSSWLSGAVRKCDGQETVLLRMGDVPPGPGSYAEPPSSFTTFSHNAKARPPNPMHVTRSSTMISRPSPRQTGAMSARPHQRHREPSPQKSSAMTRPAEPTAVDDEP